MTTILFIRHGQTNVNHMHKIQGRQNHLLNDTGRLQAKVTGEYLKENDSNWDYIYSSPLDRAYETACIIRDELNLKVDVIKNEAFIERDFGKAEGEPITKEIFDLILANNVDNLETSFEIQDRVVSGVLNIASLHPNKKIMIVAHSHTIKALLTYLDRSRLFTDTLYNCSMSYFNVQYNTITIDKVNIMPKEK